jgi:hypothetical protein
MPGRGHCGERFPRVDPAGDRDTNGNGTLDERLYALQDANYNVTAITDAAGAVVQRFGYEAYGRAKVLAANWQAAADGYDWEVRYAGYRWDSESGLYPMRLGGCGSGI